MEKSVERMKNRKDEMRLFDNQAQTRQQAEMILVEALETDSNKGQR
jgi:hypothetical protein